MAKNSLTSSLILLVVLVAACSKEAAPTDDAATAGAPLEVISDRTGQQVQVPENSVPTKAAEKVPPVPAAGDLVGGEAVVTKAPGVPQIPTLTGDRAKDKAALLAAIQTLETAWQANRAEYDSLSKEKRLAEKDPRLLALAAHDAAYKEVAGRLHGLLDGIRDQ